MKKGREKTCTPEKLRTSDSLSPALSSGGLKINLLLRRNIEASLTLLSIIIIVCLMKKTKKQIMKTDKWYL